MFSAEEAGSLSRRLIEPLGSRWRHVRSVAERAAALTSAVDDQQQETLVSAAWLHDIGYAPELARTWFHPLDGARYLRDEGWPARVVTLVAHHSGARFEAEERGLAEELAEFPFEDSPLLDALNTADLTTGPDGQPLTFDERMAEILDRYPKDDPVHRAWLRAKPVIRGCIERTEARIAERQPR